MQSDASSPGRYDFVFYAPMHGLIVNQLRHFVVARHGREAWGALVAKTDGAVAMVPSMERTYPDALVGDLVQSASEATATPVQVLLHDFGVFLAPALLRIYQPLVHRDWRTLDVIEHTEEEIHTAVRARDASATPPALVARRTSPTSVTIEYRSARRMCAVAEGIARGLAAHFGDALSIAQPKCMLRGDAHCLIQVDLVSRRDSPTVT